MGNNSDEDSALNIDFNDSEEEVDEYFLGDIEEVNIECREYSNEEHERAESNSLDDAEEVVDENGDGDGCINNRFPLHKLVKNMSEYEWELGTLYNTREDFKEAIVSYAVHAGKGLKFVKNDKERIRVRCKKGCDWKAYCAKLKGEETWQLRMINDKHTCNREVNNKLLKSKWLSKSIQKTVKENPKYKLKDIIDRSKRKWNVNVSKAVALRAKKEALNHLHGSFQEQFRRLYDYCHELKGSNPNSTVLLKVNRPPDYDAEIDTQVPSRNMLPKFERLYICFEACKKSFFTCRPIIGMDGCFLKGPYKCQLLAAVGRDPNEQMLPIAIAVVEAETKDSWTWFSSNLIEDLGGTNKCKSYTFISYQQKGLLHTFDELLPGVDHRFCVRHLYNNFRKRFPGKNLKEKMWKVAKATYPQAWERAMKDIQKVHEDAYKYLIKIPPRFWSKFRFSFEPKCDVLVNNMSEAFNSVILDAREKPIVSMLEEIRTYLMNKWAANRTKVNSFQGSILPNIKKRLEREANDSGKWLPAWAGDEKFEVYDGHERFAVDLEVKKCDCRKWSLTGIPCAHSISCIYWWSKNPEDYVPIYYRKEAYQACYEPIIFPTNGANLWITTEYPDVLPPTYRKPIGRPVKARKKDPNEENKGKSKMSRTGFASKCSVCGIIGHNKRSCKNSSSTGSHDIQTNASNTQPTLLSASTNTQISVQPSEGLSCESLARESMTWSDMQMRQESLSQPSIQASWQHVPPWRTPSSHLIQRPNKKSKTTMANITQATTSNEPSDASSNQPNAAT